MSLSDIFQTLLWADVEDLKNVSGENLFLDLYNCTKQALIRQTPYTHLPFVARAGTFFFFLESTMSTSGYYIFPEIFHNCQSRCFQIFFQVKLDIISHVKVAALLKGVSSMWIESTYNCRRSGDKVCSVETM